MNDQARHDAASLRLLVAITFHFLEDRVKYLDKILRTIAAFPLEKKRVHIFTNDQGAAASIEFHCMSAGLSREEFRISVESGMEHPFELAWRHKRIISSDFLNERLFTHFAYMEDDELLTYENFCYYVWARDILRPFGLLPSLFRIEWSDSLRAHVSSDHRKSVDVSHSPYIDTGKICFLTTPEPYCGAFILDRELAEEYILSPSFDMHRSCEVSQWEIRERAAMGLTWENIPGNFVSRIVIPVNTSDFSVPRFCCLEHLPNNYANNPQSKHTKIEVDNVFYGDLNKRFSLTRRMVMIEHLTNHMPPSLEKKIGEFLCTLGYRGIGSRIFNKAQSRQQNIDLT